MGTLYLDRRDLTLRLDGKRLVIEEPDARPRGVPLALLDRVVLQGQVHFDSNVLAALAEQGTGVICLSARHSRRTALLLGPGHGDARRRLAQYRLTLDAEARLALARRLIAGLRPRVAGLRFDRAIAAPAGRLGVGPVPGAALAGGGFRTRQGCVSTAEGEPTDLLCGLLPFSGGFCSFQGSKTVPFVIPAKAGIQWFGG